MKHHLTLKAPLRSGDLFRLELSTNTTTFLCGPNGYGKEDLIFNTLAPLAKKRTEEICLFPTHLSTLSSDSLASGIPSVTLSFRPFVTPLQSGETIASRLDAAQLLAKESPPATQCPTCGGLLKKISFAEARNIINKKTAANSRLVVTALVDSPEEQKAAAESVQLWLEDLLQRYGFSTFLVHGALLDIDEPPITLPSSAIPSMIEIVVDRLHADASSTLLQQALQAASRISPRTGIWAFPPGETEQNNSLLCYLSPDACCQRCGRSAPDSDPLHSEAPPEELFKNSFSDLLNSAQGVRSAELIDLLRLLCHMKLGKHSFRTKLAHLSAHENMRLALSWFFQRPIPHSLLLLEEPTAGFSHEREKQDFLSFLQSNTASYQLGLVLVGNDPCCKAFAQKTIPICSPSYDPPKKETGGSSGGRDTQQQNISVLTSRGEPILEAIPEKTISFVNVSLAQRQELLLRKSALHALQSITNEPQGGEKVPLHLLLHSTPHRRGTIFSSSGLQKVIAQFYLSLPQAQADGITEKHLLESPFSELVEKVRYKGLSFGHIQRQTILAAIDFLSALPKAANILTALEQLELGIFSLDTPLENLSLGDWQRLRLAKLLAQHRTNRCFIVEDIFFGLDELQQERLRYSLEQKAQQGMSFVLVAPE